MALKDLGFTLDQVATILDDEIDVDELRGMLRLRRAELREQIAADTARLARVEARLRVIEREDAMSDEIEIKTVPAVRVAELSAPVGGFEPQFITPVLGPLFDRLMSRLGASEVACVGAPIAYYEDAGDGEGLIVHAAAPIADDADADRSAGHRAARDLGGGDHPPRSDGRRDADDPDPRWLDRGARLPVRRLQPRGLPRATARACPSRGRPSSRSR